MNHRAGYIAILGSPNAGKSTLLNALLKEKIAAVTDKPQTTRKRLKGIFSTKNCQMIFLDTPGIHYSDKKLNQFMAKEVEEAIYDADVLCYLVAMDQGVSPLLLNIFENTQKKYPKKPFIWVLNKTDLKTSLRAKRGNPWIVPKGDPFEASPAPGGLAMTEEVIRVSALKKQGLEELLQKIESLLSEGPSFYPEDDLTDSHVRDLSAEIIREKLMNLMYDEIPYSAAVEIVSFKEAPEKTHITANILVEHDSQKGMVIGIGGRMIKEIGVQARREIEPLVGTKVFLELKVKVDKNWTKNSAKLARYGYISA